MARLRHGWLVAAGAVLSLASGYELQISDMDVVKQVCSGMYGGANAYINVTFDATSQGQLAIVIYEWKDMQWLGKKTTSDLPPTYICTSDAVRMNLCPSSDLGQFIFDLPAGKSQNQTSIYSASVAFHAPTRASRDRHARVRRSHLPEQRQESESPSPSPSTKASSSPPASAAPPATNPATTPAGPSTTSTPVVTSSATQPASTSPAPITSGGSAGRTTYYKEPLHYEVRTTGYYCVAAVPVTVRPAQKRQDEYGSLHPPYRGTVLFKNVFDGKLAATDYPKVQLYLALFLTYLVLGAAWGFLCWKHMQDLLPIQHYISGLVGLLCIEMIAHWAYYRYVNARGGGVSTTAFLIVVAILDAGRNALSFFLLLVVSLGLSVVRPTLGGPTMRKCQLLALAHFIFGVLYAVGIVELQLESTSAFVLLVFVIPLAFTLSTFLLWIMYSLNGTITQLAARKQRYKLAMFRRLYWSLVGSVAVILIFFVVSSMSFSSRLHEDYAANSWQYRWWLLDGWLALLYLCVFAYIAYIWRPSENNMR